MAVLEIIVFVLLAYCMGSISSAILVCRMLHLPDPRTQGSLNPGTTNVLRIGGKGPALLTLFGDVLKGALPVLFAKWCGLNGLALAWVAFAAFLGHLYPVFFRFQGGKGVATALGCLLALSWPIGLLSALTWAIVAICFRYSSLAALTTAVLVPFYTFYLGPTMDTLMVAAMALLLIYRHKNNIHNLLTGNETKMR